jgi:nucleoid DNA-binding protein
MLYAKLVARIAEVTRTLVERGSKGNFEKNSRKFCVGGQLPASVKTGFFLKILEGDAAGVYEVKNVGVDYLGVENRFRFESDEVPWELYDAGVSDEHVRKVLFKLPDVIMECEEGEQVKTYLGVFRIVRRKEKRVKDPQGRWTVSKERLHARIRPGKRLQRELNPDPEAPNVLSMFSSEGEDPDEDPQV